MLISSNLSDLWTDSTFDTWQKQQNLLFPSGVKYNKQENSYLTIKENIAFYIFSKSSMNYKSEETKKEPPFDGSCSLVAEEGLEPTTFGL